jgi:hypothetical protein
MNRSQMSNWEFVLKARRHRVVSRGKAQLLLPIGEQTKTDAGGYKLINTPKSRLSSSTWDHYFLSWRVSQQPQTIDEDLNINKAGRLYHRSVNITYTPVTMYGRCKS